MAKSQIIKKIVSKYPVNKTKIKIKLTDNKGTSKKKDDVSITIPVNPNKIGYKASGRFQEYEIINKGLAKVPSGKDLTYISWESFFPGECLQAEPYVHNFVKSTNKKGKKTYFKAKDIHNKIESWRSKGTKLKLTISGTPINLYVYIENYEASWEGSNGNIYYAIELSGAVDVTVETVKKKNGKTSGTSRSSKKTSTKKYTIKKGDTLWSIGKKFYKKASMANCKKIYNANKTTIENAAKKHGKKSSSNGHWIYPGTVLKIP